MGPKFNDTCPYRREAGGDVRQTESRRQCGHRGPRLAGSGTEPGMAAVTRTQEDAGALPPTCKRKCGPSASISVSESRTVKINAFLF